MNIMVNKLSVLSKKTEAGTCLYWHKSLNGEDVWGGLSNAIAFIAPYDVPSIEGAVTIRLIDAAMIG